MKSDSFQKRIRLLNPPGGRQPGRVDEETQAKISELSTEVETKVNQILTQAQQEKFAELKVEALFDLSLLRQQPAFTARRNNE